MTADANKPVQYLHDKKILNLHSVRPGLHFTNTLTERPMILSYRIFLEIRREIRKKEAIYTLFARLIV